MLVDIAMVSFFLNIFSTAGRSIRHSGGCDGERVKATNTRKMVPITGRARSFLLVFKNKIESRGDRIKTTGLLIYSMV